MCKELVEEKVWENFKREHMEDYLEITRSFESKKRTIKPDKSGSIRISIPYELIKLCLKSHGVKCFNEIIQKNEDNVTISAGKLVWKNDYFRGFFKISISAIVKYIDEILQETKARDIEVI